MALPDRLAIQCRFNYTMQLFPGCSCNMILENPPGWAPSELEWNWVPDTLFCKVELNCPNKWELLLEANEPLSSHVTSTPGNIIHFLFRRNLTFMTLSLKIRNLRLWHKLFVLKSSKGAMPLRLKIVLRNAVGSVWQVARASRCCWGWSWRQSARLGNSLHHGDQREVCQIEHQAKTGKNKP